MCVCLHVCVCCLLALLLRRSLEGPHVGQPPQDGRIFNHHEEGNDDPGGVYRDELVTLSVIDTTRLPLTVQGLHQERTENGDHGRCDVGPVDKTSQGPPCGFVDDPRDGSDHHRELYKHLTYAEEVKPQRIRPDQEVVLPHDVVFDDVLGPLRVDPTEYEL